MIKKMLMLIFVFLTKPTMALPGHIQCASRDKSDCCHKHPYGLCKDSSSEAMMYKILRENEWKDFETNGYFKGSVHDRRDGFIHMSMADQMNRVISKYFSKESIYIVGFYLNDYEDSLKWGSGHPHIYERSLDYNLIIGSYHYKQ